MDTTVDLFSMRSLTRVIHAAFVLIPLLLAAFPCQAVITDASTVLYYGRHCKGTGCDIPDEGGVWISNYKTQTVRCIWGDKGVLTDGAFFRPDGREVAIIRDGTLIIVNSDGTNERTYTLAHWEDGRNGWGYTTNGIVYTGANDNVYCFDPATEETTILVHGGFYSTRFTVSADGLRGYETGALEEGVKGGKTYELAALDATAQLKDFGIWGHGNAMSGDGNWIFMLCWQPHSIVLIYDFNQPGHMGPNKSQQGYIAKFSTQENFGSGCPNWGSPKQVVNSGDYVCVPMGSQYVEGGISMGIINWRDTTDKVELPHRGVASTGNAFVGTIELPKSPVLKLDRTELFFAAEQTETPSPGVVTVTNEGSGTLGEVRTAITYRTHSGVQSGGSYLGWIGTGDWAGYYGIDFGTGGFDTLTIRASNRSSDSARALLRLESETGPVVATIPVAVTGDWSAYQLFSAPITQPLSGTQSVYLTFEGGMNVDWMQFTGTTHLQIEAEDFGTGKEWLQVTVEGPGGNSQTLTNTVNPEGLPDGEHQAEVTVSGGGADNKVSYSVILAAGRILATPTNLTAEVTGEKLTDVTLSWTDNAADEEGFRIQRKQPEGEWQSIQQVGANQTSYTDGNLRESSVYIYRIQAFAGTRQSSWSTEKSVVVSGTPWILVSAPAENAVIVANDTCHIEWSANLVEVVRIRYSIDDGENWEPVTRLGGVGRDEPEWGHYPWVVPDVVAESVIIAIDDYMDVTVLAVSPPFSIVESSPVKRPAEPGARRGELSEQDAEVFSISGRRLPTHTLRNKQANTGLYLVRTRANTTTRRIIQVR